MNSLEQKSRTQIKKDAQRVQKLGEKLLELSTGQIESFDLPDDLKAALIEARGMTSKNARRRQIQYIGALMRSVDPEPIETHLDLIESGISPKRQSQEQARTWYDLLMSGDDDTVNDIITACPGADRQKLRQLIRNAKKETAENETATISKKLMKYLVSIQP